MCWLLVPIVSELPQLAVPHSQEFLGGLGPPKNLFSFVDIYEVTIYVSVSISYKS